MSVRVASDCDPDGLKNAAGESPDLSTPSVSCNSLDNGVVGGEADGAHAPQDSDLSEEARDCLDQVDFLWETGDDAQITAFTAQLNCTPWTIGTLPRFVRGRPIVVASRDDEQAAQAHETAGQCLKYGAASVRIWTIPEFGSIYPTMRAWCAKYSLVALLGIIHAGRWEAFVGLANDSEQVSPVFSEDPRPITTDLLPVPGLDPRMIPAPLRGWLIDIADRGWFPPEYPAAAAIVGLSGLIGRRIAIRPKRRDDWLVVPNLWGAVVGPPGIQKSPAIEEALRPLKRLATDAIAAHESQIKEYLGRQLVSSARKGAAKKALEQAAKKGSSDQALSELAREALADDASSPPTAHRYLVNDATLEKLGEILKENPNGVVLFRDELSGWLKSMDRQGHESDRGFYLEAWNGNGSYTWDRIGRGTVHIPSVCVSVFGTIQPGPLSRYLRASISGEEADGLMPRFQVMLYPDPPDRFINVDRYPNAQAKNGAYEIFTALGHLDPVVRGCQVDQERNLPYLNFSPQAQDFFDDWRIALETRLSSRDLSNLMECHLAKFRSLLPSLALIFHLIETHADHPLPPVSLEATELAAAWCDLLEGHARRIYQAGSDGDPDDAIRLAEKIRQSLPNPFTYRDVQRKGWSGLSNNEDVRRAVGILEDRGWVKVVKVSHALTGGGPAEKVFTHPKLLNPGANGQRVDG